LTCSAEVSINVILSVRRFLVPAGPGERTVEQCVYQLNYCSYYYFCDIFAHLQSGEILIVSFTDVGWSPYFPLVSGLVTEIGGIVSHGIKDTFAVVAMSFAGVAVWLS